MKRLSRNLLLASAMVAGVACDDTNYIPTDPNEFIQVGRDNSPLQTGSLAYQLQRLTGEYRVHVVAWYKNRTGANVYYERCDGNSTGPMYGVGRTGPDSLRTFFTDFGWACVGGVPTGVIRPGDSVMVRVPVGSTDQLQMTPPLQREWLVGTLRISLGLCAGVVMNSDDCKLLPAPQRQSNAFVVHY